MLLGHVREGRERKRIYRMYIIGRKGGRKEGRKSGVKQREGRGRWYYGNWCVIK